MGRKAKFPMRQQKPGAIKALTTFILIRAGKSTWCEHLTRVPLITKCKEAPAKPAVVQTVSERLDLMHLSLVRVYIALSIKPSPLLARKSCLHLSPGQTTSEDTHFKSFVSDKSTLPPL